MRRILVGSRFLALLFATEVLVVVALFSITTRPASAIPGPCEGHVRVAGADPGGPHYFGAYGVNTTSDANATSTVDDFFVNSTSVWHDPLNYAEVGWIWRGTWTSPRAFIAWADDVHELYDDFDPLTVVSTHVWQVNRRTATSTTWDFYKDAQPLDSKILPLQQGWVGAQQERNFACNNSDGTLWYDLGKADSQIILYFWDGMFEAQDNDDYYCWSPGGAPVQLRVIREGRPGCQPPPEVVDPKGSSYSHHSLTRDQDGVLYAAYVADDSELWLAHRNATSSSWTLRQLTSDGLSPREPDIVVNNGMIHLTWSSPSVFDGVHHLYYMSFTALGPLPTSTQLFVGEATGWLKSKMALDSAGQVHVVYMKNTDHRGIFYNTLPTFELQEPINRLASSTATGGAANKLIDTTKDSELLGVTVGDTVVNTTKGRIAKVTSISTTTNPNDTLTAYQISGEADDAYFVHTAVYFFDTAVDSSDALHFVGVSEGNGLEVRYLKRTGGGSWGSEETVDDGGGSGGVGRARQVAIALDSSGDVHVVWQARGYAPNPTRWSVQYNKKIGATWGTQFTVAAKPANQIDPILSVPGNDDLWVVWVDERVLNGSDYAIRARRYTIAWQAEETVEEGVTDILYDDTQSLWAWYPVISGFRRAAVPVTGIAFLVQKIEQSTGDRDLLYYEYKLGWWY